MNSFKFITSIVFFVFISTSAFAHVLHYELKKGAYYVEVFFGGGDKASYSPYEIYAPDSSLPFAKGDTDARGVLAFLPDKNGIWHIVVHAGSDHGEHRVEFDIEIKDGTAKLERTPLYNQYGAMITGISIIFGIFGLIYGIKARQKLNTH